MRIEDTGKGSTSALSSDLKNEPEQISLAPEGDYLNAQKRLNTSYMNQRTKNAEGKIYLFGSEAAALRDYLFF